MKKIFNNFLIAVALSGSLFISSNAVLAKETQTVPPETAMQKLIDGNIRYVLGKSEKPRQNSERRKDVAQSQHPFAIIVTCSDSRVPPEILFDQGIGDLFIIRTAGNVIDDAALGSIEYAAEHLGVQLVAVVGHERCGAVDATVKGGEAPGHIANLVKYIEPAVKKAKEKKGGDILDNSIHENVLMTVEKLKESKPLLKELCEKGKLKAVGAYYDLDSGTVEFIEDKKEKKDDVIIDK